MDLGSDQQLDWIEKNIEEYEVLLYSDVDIVIFDLYKIFVDIEARRGQHRVFFVTQLTSV